MKLELKKILIGENVRYGIYRDGWYLSHYETEDEAKLAFEKAKTLPDDLSITILTYTSEDSNNTIKTEDNG